MSMDILRINTEPFDLTSPFHVNLKFIKACEAGDLDEIKYWLSDPNIPLNADINAEKNFGLKAACVFDHHPIIEYLIIDMNMSIDMETRNWLNGDNTSKSIFKFALKLLEMNDLSNELNCKKEVLNKPKMKI